uniref:C-type lectin domain-containing protein n=1 Tax=Panagrellus redivivus TaxID=6233 RepID=A0A7E4VXA3_PANRE
MLIAQSMLILAVLTITSASKSESSENGWVPFRGHLYYLVRESLFRADAEARCVEMGGHLVSIHNNAENKFVHKLRDRNAVWLGLSKNGLNDTYKWSDGSPHDFPIPWDLRQPNEPWTDCIFMAYRANNLGRWSDFFCDSPDFPVYYFPSPPYTVCKKPQVNNEL